MSDEMKFRAGDAVKHHPSGEEWLLATDQERDQVCAAGWPETIAEAADCTLLEAADDATRLDMLERAAKTGGLRGGWASQHLRAARQETPTP